MEFKNELEKIRETYQKSLDELKHELRGNIHKQAALMRTVNIMADNIAERNLLIEELCIYIDEHDDAGNTKIAQSARERIMS